MVKLVLSVNRRPGETVPTPRQLRLALGKMTSEAVVLLEKWDGSSWMTIVREVKEK